MPKGGNSGKGNSGGDDSDGVYLKGNRRDNVLEGTDGDDVLDGNEGDDTLYGYAGDDLLMGDEGNDTLYGGEGADRLYGGAGNDALYGGAGDDWLQGNTGSDLMDGGEGRDTASFEEIAPAADGSGVTLTTDHDATGSTYTVVSAVNDDSDTVVNVERVIGSNYDDTMTGGAGDDHFVGARGRDTIDGGAGDDVIYGSLDDDALTGGEGADTFVFLRYEDSYGTWRGDGHDVIEDFDVAADVIEFIGSEPVPYTVTDTADGAVISYAEDSAILLWGVSAESLTADNFAWEFVAV